MSTYDGAVEHQVLHIGILDEVLMHSLPNALVAPPGEAFVDAIPFLVVAREQTPLGPAAQDPEYSLDKPPTGFWVADAHLIAGQKQGKYLGPGRIADVCR